MHAVVIGCLLLLSSGEGSHRSLMDAFANVLQVRPGVKLMLVGDGPCLLIYRSTAGRLALSATVYLFRPF